MAKLGGAGGAEASVEVVVGEDGVPVFTIAGELDVSNVDELRAVVEPVLQQAPARIVFDLSALEFMDSSGIALLLQSAARVAQVRLRNPSHIVRRVVTSTGLTDTLPIES
jgi:anti-anti-sigma factor